MHHAITMTDGSVELMQLAGGITDPKAATAKWHPGKSARVQRIDAITPEQHAELSRARRAQRPPAVVAPDTAAVSPPAIDLTPLYARFDSLEQRLAALESAPRGFDEAPAAPAVDLTAVRNQLASDMGAVAGAIQAQVDALGSILAPLRELIPHVPVLTAAADEIAKKAQEGTT